MKKNKSKIRMFLFTVFMAAGTTFGTIQAQNLGVRSNILTLATLSPSLGVDIQFAGRWQAGIDGHTGLLGKCADYLQMSGAGFEMRRYFFNPYHSADINTETNGEGSSFHGPYMGINTRYLKYNDQMRNSCPRDGWFYTAGVTVGYTFWLPRNWTVDLGVGAGYVHKDYKDYDYYVPHDKYRLINNRITNRFGLTNAELSVAYHFSIGNNKK